jgi:hypothetical protein
VEHQCIVCSRGYADDNAIRNVPVASAPVAEGRRRANQIARWNGMNQLLVAATAEKVFAMQTEEFFATRNARADRKGFRRILNRRGGEPLRPDDKADTP